MTRPWTDDPNGLSVNLRAINNPDIGTAQNPLGTVYAQNVEADSIVGDTTLAFNNYLSAIGSTGQTLDLLKGDASDNTVINYPTGKTFRIEEGGVLAASFDASNELILALGGLTVSAVGKTVTLTAGSNGKAGTVTLNGATPVSVANTSITAGSVVIFTLKTVGGTVGAYPAIQTITPATGFDVAGTALDTSVYNYAIIETA